MRRTLQMALIYFGSNFVVKDVRISHQSSAFYIINRVQETSPHSCTWSIIKFAWDWWIFNEEFKYLRHRENTSIIDHELCMCLNFVIIERSQKISPWLRQKIFSLIIFFCGNLKVRECFEKADAESWELWEYFQNLRRCGQGWQRIQLLLNTQKALKTKANTLKIS